MRSLSNGVMMVPIRCRPKLDIFQDQRRSVGIYCLKDNNSWTKPFDKANFRTGSCDALQIFFQDILKVCMDVGQVEVGSFTSAYSALKSYTGWN